MMGRPRPTTDWSAAVGNRPVTVVTRIDLHVPFAQKDDAKALGARWDSSRRTWYAPPGTTLADFQRWLPAGSGTGAGSEAANPTIRVDAVPPATSTQGVGLSEFLVRVQTVIDRSLPEPAWIRAEVSEMRTKNGHVYLTLTERDERGDALANAKAILWRNRATAVAEKFERATGEGLRPDIKILLLARVRFEPLFGLDLVVEDVDPSYTLGDLAAKLARIRAKLQAEGIAGRNRALPAPTEFVRVAVVSPETSAGLGDFRQETDRLQAAGLCRFVFQGATFQGPTAPGSIRTAIAEALAEHRRAALDAVIVIRGGGSATDLAWLNDLELARVVCLCPVPVLTGIGHERDATVLDEVAHRRFDTPSKVALHLSRTIRDNAMAALGSLERIAAEVGRLLARERAEVAALAARVESTATTWVDRARDHAAQVRDQTGVAARSLLREAAITLDHDRARIGTSTSFLMSTANTEADRLRTAVADRTRVQVEARSSDLARAAEATAHQAQAALFAAARDLGHHRDGVAASAVRAVATAQAELICAREAAEAAARTRVEDAQTQAAGLARVVVGLGPESTLRRGFALVRGPDDQPVTAREQATRQPGLTIQFHDGAVAVGPPHAVPAKTPGKEAR